MRRIPQHEQISTNTLCSRHALRKTRVIFSDNTRPIIFGVIRTLADSGGAQMIENFSPDTKPLWSDTAVIKKHLSQSEQIAVDVCIVGAGITGLTAADLLKNMGKTVAVIDLSRVGFGETSHTTAHITEVFDLSYTDLIARFGLEGAELASHSVRRAIDRIEENVHRYGVDCDFRRLSGYRFTEKREQIEELEAEANAALQIGVPNELVTEAPLPFDTCRAIRFDHQAQFNPLQYLSALAQRIPGNGSYIFEDTRMLDVDEGTPCRVTTDRGTIVANDVFVAANVPSTNRFFLHTKIAAYRTYAIAAKVQPRADDAHLFWDMDDPYHYIRSYQYGDQTYLIVGGEDHKTGHGHHNESAFERLIEWTQDRFEIQAISHKWSGQIIEPVDGLPYIGRNPLSEHVYVATGFSGTGLTFGTVAGMLVADLITGSQNPWAELYDAGRVKPLASMRTFLSENIDYPSRLISDRLTPAQQSEARIREHEGAIIRMGGKKVAAYRDPEGTLHLLSPVCPHLGCYVHWNDAEKSWDCPCHGSRFNPVGQLLNGPAVSDLASETYDENARMIPEPYEQPVQSPNPLGSPVLSLFTCPLKKKPSLS